MWAVPNFIHYYEYQFIIILLIPFALPAMKRPVMLSPKKIADALDVTRRAVYKWISKGDLSSTKVGGSVRISEADLAGFIGEEKAEQVFDRYAE